MKKFWFLSIIGLGISLEIIQSSKGDKFARLSDNIATSDRCKLFLGHDWDVANYRNNKVKKEVTNQIGTAVCQRFQELDINHSTTVCTSVLG